MNILQKILILTLPLLLIGSLSSCDDMIYDDLAECPQGVDFRFYTQTPCQQTPSYPMEIKETRVFAFGESGILLKEYDTKEVVLSEEYTQRVDFYHVGTSSFVAWGGEDLSKYDFSPFEVGKTTKGEMIVALQRQADSVTANMPHLYVGEPIEGTLTQEDRSEIGTFYDVLSFNMQQLTNTLHLTIHGLSPRSKYQVMIEAANSRYDILGNMLKDSRFTYLSPNHNQEKDLLKADFCLLKLEENKDIHLVITDVEKGKQVYRADLIDDLILYRSKQELSPIKLECEHVFDLELFLEPDSTVDETFIAVRAIINQWNIVFREVILGDK